MIKQPNSHNCFICGVKNAAGVHVNFYETTNDEGVGEVVARFTGQPQHRGYPYRMHGGVITGILDETIGRAVNIGEGEDPSTPGVTAELSVRFRKPVPVGVELEACWRINRCDIHHLFEGTGEIYLPDGTVAASAHGSTFASSSTPSPTPSRKIWGWRVYQD